MSYGHGTRTAANLSAISDDRRCCARRTYHIRVAGPSMSGKTTVIKWSKYGTFVQTQPTVGLEVDRVRCSDMDLVMWDSRQQQDEAVRSHNPKFRGIFFVVDASDMGRLNIASRGLDQLRKDLPDAHVLVVYVTKIDKLEDNDGEVIKEKIMKNLKLTTVVEKEWKIFLCSGRDGRGIDSGVKWMTQQLLASESWWTTCWANLFCNSCRSKPIGD